MVQALMACDWGSVVVRLISTISITTTITGRRRMVSRNPRAVGALWKRKPTAASYSASASATNRNRAKLRVFRQRECARRRNLPHGGRLHDAGPATVLRHCQRRYGAGTRPERLQLRTPTSTVIRVPLHAGSNQIEFNNSINYAPNLDSIIISPRIDFKAGFPKKLSEHKRAGFPSFPK